MKARVFAYLRVSTFEQKDKGGYARQKETVDNFCREQGYHIMRTFGDQQSGATAFENRVQLQECLDLCTQATGVNIIVVERVDRIARDMIEQEVFLRECAKRKVLVFVAETGEEMVQADSTPDRKLIRRIMGALAEWDKDQTAKKLLAGRRRKKLLTGKPCGGPAPYQNAEVIALIVSARCNGISYQRIAARFNTDHIPAPDGGRYWFPTTVKRIFDRESGTLYDTTGGRCEMVFK